MSKIIVQKSNCAMHSPRIPVTYLKYEYGQFFLILYTNALY